MKNFTLEPASNRQEAHLELLKNSFEPEKPLAKLIKTTSGGYLYDTGTNKLLGCTPQVFDLLNSLFINKNISKAREDFISKHGEERFQETAKEIACAITSENVLKTKKATRFGMSDHFKDVDDLINTSVMSIHLEVTQECNLRCGYCVYHNHVDEHRGYDNKHMNIETARQAIRFLKDHSTESKSTGIGFYGGEPLLRFPFIKQCVEYARSILKNRELIFTITTNAVLVTPEIARFLLEQGFSIVVSLDGPEEIHDKYRKTRNGTGSYEGTIKGLKILAEAYREIKKGNISINAVYAPPFSPRKLNAIQDFLSQLKWLPENNFAITYPNEGSIPGDIVPKEERGDEKSMTSWAFDQYRSRLDQSHRFIRGIMDQQFARLMQRPIFAEPRDRYYLNGCCVPGHRKNYIDVNGNIHVCEKMPFNAPTIGHVSTGYHYDTIKDFYIREYADKSITDCSKCWGLRLCELCYYMAIGSDGKIDLAKKRKVCRNSLKGFERTISQFITLLEENPGKLDYLHKYELV